MHVFKNLCYENSKEVILRVSIDNALPFNSPIKRRVKNLFKS